MVSPYADLYILAGRLAAVNFATICKMKWLATDNYDFSASRLCSVTRRAYSVSSLR